VLKDWRELYNEKLNNSYSSSDIIGVVKPKGMKWTELVACITETRSSYKTLVGKYEGKRRFGRPRCRRKNNIKMVKR
jgi:hypothetical protein